MDADTKMALVDPDPAMLDLLLNIAATTIGGGLLSVASMFLGRQRNNVGEQFAYREQLHLLREKIVQLDTIARAIERVIVPTSRRSLNSRLLLTMPELQEFDRLKERLFDEIQSIDRLTRTFGPVAMKDNVRPKLPPELREHVKYIEKRLRDARTAALSHQALSDIRSALASMLTMMDSVLQPEHV